MQDAGCSNRFTWSGTLIITGVNLSAPGPIAGTIEVTNETTVQTNPNGTCTYAVVPGTAQFNYTGFWDGTRGTITFSGPEGGGGTFTANGTFTIQTSHTPPVFPMTVTGNTPPTVANAQATFQPRPQDAGTQNSVYVFALAPATVVR